MGNGVGNQSPSDGDERLGPVPVQFSPEACHVLGASRVHQHPPAAVAEKMIVGGAELQGDEIHHSPRLACARNA